MTSQLVVAALLPLAAAESLSSQGVFNCGVVTCPQQSVIVVEQLGKFHGVLQPGLHIGWPWPIKSMRMLQLRERPFDVQRVPAITRDNVDMFLDAVVYLRIVDPYLASYAVSDPVHAMLILAQTTVRSRIGEMTLDQTFKNREELNAHVVAALDRAGRECEAAVPFDLSREALVRKGPHVAQRVHSRWRGLTFDVSRSQGASTARGSKCATSSRPSRSCRR